MPPWIVFAPVVGDDEALANAHWIATQTRGLLPPPARFIDGSSATRAVLEAVCALHGDDVGLALFAHGDQAAVYGADDEPALDGANVRASWVHAFACRTGIQLASEAAARGVGCYLGYNVSLLVGWSIEALHPELRTRLAGLVVAASAALLHGERSRRALVREVSDVADALVDWINTYAPDEHIGLGVLADMLVDRVVLTGSAVTP